MKMDSNKLFGVLAVASAFVLSACGSGGGSGTATNTSASTISGVAASGAPVSQGMGYALDASTGNKTSFVSDANGAYSVNLSGQTGPFLIRVRGLTTSGAMVDLYSLASTSNFGATVNVTPLSDIVVGYAAGKRTDELEAACTATLASCPALLNGIIANLALSSTQIIQALPASVLSAFSIDPATFNPITTTFTANHSGADALLDALQVVPPAAGVTSGNYAINLNGAIPVPLVTVPVTSAATATVPTTNSTAPTTVQITQAANLVTALTEVQTFLGQLNSLFATAMPTSGELSPFFDATFLHNGINKTLGVPGMLTGAKAIPVGSKFVSGGLAAYPGRPLTGGATTPGTDVVTYDGNNCVTSIWSNYGLNGIVQDSILLKNAIPGSNAAGVCTGGTWTIAGNQRNYTSRITSQFMKLNNFGATPIYRHGFNLNTMVDETAPSSSSFPQTKYTRVTISGPGITTMGDPSGSNGTVTLIPATSSVKQNNLIDDPVYGSTYTNNPYYPGALEGDNQLRDCTQLTIGVVDQNWLAPPTASTPCLNMAAVVVGGDYTIKFYNGATLLETDMQRLTVAPVSVPQEWFPTITSVTPAGPSMTSAGATVTANWTMPTGSVATALFLNVNDPLISTLMNVQASMSPTATSGSVTVPTLPAATGGGHTGLPGLDGNGISSAYALVVTAIGGVNVITAQPF